ncbi:MAG: TA system VapC family ribonuclease toxin [Myxococcales bacterium]
MIAVDTNVLIHAHRESSPLHEAAARRLAELAEGAALWGLPVFCLGEFVRVVTHPRFVPPSSIEEACRFLEALLESPSVRVLGPRERYWPLFREALDEGRAAGNLAFDAQLVALCREAGVSTLVTEDRDFGRFSGFRTQRLS